MEEMEINFGNIKQLNQELNQRIIEAYENVYKVSEEFGKIMDQKQENLNPTASTLEENLPSEKELLFLESSKQNSIKPNVKVKNVRKRKQISFKKSAYFLATSLSLSTLLSIGSIYGMNHYKQYQNMASNNKVYMETIYQPNTINRGVDYNAKTGTYYPVHDHDWASMMKNLSETYSDPLIGFYFLYANLDDYCKNNQMSFILTMFNLIIIFDRLSKCRRSS